MNLKYLPNDSSRERAARMFGMTERTDDGCIVWTRAMFANGYGQFPINTVMGKMQYVHRIAYLLHYGPFDPKLFVRHSCHNRACCNPEHLMLGTHADNMADMVEAARQWRPRGEKHGRATVTEDQVHQIRDLFQVKRKTMRQMAAYRATAEEVGTNWSTVKDVVTGRSWAWLPLRISA